MKAHPKLVVICSLFLVSGRLFGQSVRERPLQPKPDADAAAPVDTGRQAMAVMLSTSMPNLLAAPRHRALYDDTTFAASTQLPDEITMADRRHGAVEWGAVGAALGALGGLVMADAIRRDDQQSGYARPNREYVGVILGSTGAFAILGAVGGFIWPHGASD